MSSIWQHLIPQHQQTDILTHRLIWYRGQTLLQTDRQTAMHNAASTWGLHNGLSSRDGPFRKDPTQFDLMYLRFDINRLVNCLNFNLQYSMIIAVFVTNKHASAFQMARQTNLTRIWFSLLYWIESICPLNQLFSALLWRPHSSGKVLWKNKAHFQCWVGNSSPKWKKTTSLLVRYHSDRLNPFILTFFWLWQKWVYQSVKPHTGLTPHF